MNTTGLSSEAVALMCLGGDRDYYCTLAVELAQRCDEATVREAEAATVKRMREGR